MEPEPEPEPEPEGGAGRIQKTTTAARRESELIGYLKGPPYELDTSIAKQRVQALASGGYTTIDKFRQLDKRQLLGCGFREGDILNHLSLREQAEQAIAAEADRVAAEKAEAACVAEAAC